MAFSAKARRIPLVMLQLFYNADSEITFVWWLARDLDPIMDGHHWAELERNTPHRQAPPIGKMITRLAALAKSSV